MKLTRSLFSLPCLAAALAFTVAVAPRAIAAEHSHDHGHEHAKKEAGPNGGRLITSVEPHAEFFVTAERKVQITFVDDAGKVVAPAGQVVTVTAGDRSAPTKLTFAAAGNSLISNAVLPAGNDFPTVVQIKASADAKTVTEKFNLNMSKCSDCSLAEYACTCAH